MWLCLLHCKNCERSLFKLTTPYFVQKMLPRQMLGCILHYHQRSSFSSFLLRRMLYCRLSHKLCHPMVRISTFINYSNSINFNPKQILLAKCHHLICPLTTINDIRFLYFQDHWLFKRLLSVRFLNLQLV